MNKLSIDKQTRAISALVEGCSIRSTERMTGIHRDTIMRLMVRVGNACEQFMDKTLRNLDCKKIQVDEIWTYVAKKQRHVKRTDNMNECGDFWTWVALDADTKLVPTYKVGKRDWSAADDFITDLSSRLKNKVQLSSDMLKLYVEAVESAFGPNVDYGQIVKSYEAEPIGAGRYSPPHVVSADRKSVFGNPNFSDISTSYIERQNLTMRMSMRRFTRLTNAFSKKYENLRAAVGLHFMYYNFARIHKTLRVTPAMEAGIESHVWDMKEIVSMAN